MKLEEHPGSITIETPEGKICLASEEAFDLLSWLYNRRAWLFQSSQHDRQAQALANGQERRARDEQLSKISKHVAWVVLDTKGLSGNNCSIEVAMRKDGIVPFTMEGIWH